MSNSVYKVIDLVGASTISWEDASKTAIERASKTLRDLRIAEVKKMDIKLEDGKPALFRVNLRLSFKFEN